MTFRQNVTIISIHNENNIEKIVYLVNQKKIA